MESKSKYAFRRPEVARRRSKGKVMLEKAMTQAFFPVLLTPPISIFTPAKNM